jgi:enoyl-CoA hydratase
MAGPVVRSEIQEGLMVITIDRPAARNAINAAVARELAAALETLDSDPGLRVGILTGAQSNFCAGMDLKAFVQGEEVIVPGRGFAGIAEKPPHKPLIAAVEGYALAGGFELALACDLIIAGDDAKFGIPEVKRGLAAGGGALLRLPHQMPYRIAMELALTGDIVSAQRMQQFGLINRIVAGGRALEEAKSLAGKIIENSPLGVAASKAIIQRCQDWPIDSMFRRQDEFIAGVITSEDAREGAIAFAEKRKPVWQGR